MSRPRIGEVMVDLGLLTQAQVSLVLDAMRAQAQGRFGEVALAMKLVDEAQLARAVAEQFRLRMVPDVNVARLTVAEAVLSLVPREVVRDHLMVPTFFDPEREVLSLLVADPTDVPGLRLAKEASRAQLLRLFVGTRSAVAALAARLLPEDADPEPADRAPARATPVVLETRLPLLAALKRVAELEGSSVELVSDPDAVTALVESGAADRVLVRAAVAPLADPYLGAWQRARPDLVVTRLAGFSPAHAPELDPRASVDFFLGLLEFALLAGERQQVALRAEVQRMTALCRAVARELGLSATQQDAVAIAALLYHAEKLSAFGGLAREGVHQGRFATALALLGAQPSPYPVAELLRALEPRLSPTSEPGEALGVEVLYTVARALALGLGGRVDAAEILDAEAGRHDPRVVAALSRALRREQLRAQLDEGGERSARRVLVAEPDPDTLTALEARLRAAGFAVEVVADGEQALERALAAPPDALVANLRLPRRDGLSLVLALKREAATAALPVLLLTDRPGPADRARGLEAGALDVLEKPVNGSILLTLLQRSIAPRATPAAAVSGRLSELGLAELLQTLSLGGRSAELRVLAGSAPGRVALDGGNIVFAAWGEVQGNEALFALMALGEGRFEVHFGREAPPPNVRGQTDFLILEGLRRVDEGRRPSSEGPDEGP